MAHKQQETPAPTAPVELTSAPQKPITLAVGGAVILDHVEVPDDIYNEAVEDHRQFCFAEQIGIARQPAPVKEHVPPPVPPAIAAQTKLEMEAGKARVAECAANEVERKRITEAHKNDRWADKPPEQVFRPGNHVPDPKRAVDVRSVQAPMTTA